MLIADNSQIQPKLVLFQAFKSEFFPGILKNINCWRILTKSNNESWIYESWFSSKKMSVLILKETKIILFPKINFFVDLILKQKSVLRANQTATFVEKNRNSSIPDSLVGVMSSFYLPEPKNWILNWPFSLDLVKNEEESLKHDDTTKNDTNFCCYYILRGCVS